MSVLSDRYTCEYGWSLNLPADWERLPGSTTNVLALSQPVVFAKQGESEISLTWMVRGHPVNKDTARAFEEATAKEGPADKESMTAVIKHIFALIGRLDQAYVCTLPDGSRAAETLESYDEGELKRGYQLIVPLDLPATYEPTFQRLCFYAPDHLFRDNLEEVQKIARSFHYDRMNGLE